MNILLLIPAILSIISNVGIPLLEQHNIPVISGLMNALTNSPTGSKLVSAIESAIGNIEDSKKQLLIMQLDSMLGQINLDSLDAQSDSKFRSYWRPFLAWGLSIVILVHCTIFETVNVLHMLGFQITQIAPIESMVITLIGGLLGLYMGSRTLEKIRGQ